MEHLQPKQQPSGKSIRLVVVLFAAIACAVLLDISLCRSVNAQLVNPVLVNPTINQKMTSGNGFQLVSGPGCTTPAGPAGAGCSVVLTWPNPFVDTSVDIVCSCLGSPQGSAFIGQVQNTATTVTVFILTPSTTAESCNNVACIGIHP